MITEYDQEQIDEVIDNFNFDKIKKVMDILDWHWYDAQTYSKVPSIGEMRKNCRRIIKNAILHAKKSNENAIVACGGFVAEAVYCDNNLFVCLSFIAEEFANS